MRNTNRAPSVTGRAGKAALGIAVAGGAAVFVLAGSGIAMASPLPAQVTSTTTGWSRVNNEPGGGSPSTIGAGAGKGSTGGGAGACVTTGAGAGKLNGLCGQPGNGSTPPGSAPTSPTGWSRVNNVPGNGSTPPGSAPTSPTGWNRVNNVPGSGSLSTTGGGAGKGLPGGGTCVATGAGAGKLNGLCGQPGNGSTPPSPAPTSPTGWSRVNNN